MGDGFGEAVGELDAEAEPLADALEVAEAVAVGAEAKRSYSSGEKRCSHEPSSYTK